MKSTDKNKIVYSDKDLLAEEDFHPRNVKERITIYFDQDLLDHFRALARRPGSEGYQVLINKTLREHVFQEKSLEDRLSALEATVYKKVK